METTLWLKTSFSTDAIPDWPCPICGKALLTLDEKEFRFEETPTSKKEHKDSDWEPEFIEYRFTGLMRCSNPKCSEIVTFTGTGGVELNQYVDHNDEYFTNYEDYFTPNILSLHFTCSN